MKLIMYFLAIFYVVIDCFNDINIIVGLMAVQTPVALIHNEPRVFIGFNESLKVIGAK